MINALNWFILNVWGYFCHLAHAINMLKTETIIAWKRCNDVMREKIERPSCMLNYKSNTWEASLFFALEQLRKLVEWEHQISILYMLHVCVHAQMPTYLSICFTKGESWMEVELVAELWSASLQYLRSLDWQRNCNKTYICLLVHIHISK